MPASARSRRPCPGASPEITLQLDALAAEELDRRARVGAAAPRRARPGPAAGAARLAAASTPPRPERHAPAAGLARARVEQPSSGTARARRARTASRRAVAALQRRSRGERHVLLERRRPRRDAPPRSRERRVLRGRAAPRSGRVRELLRLDVGCGLDRDDAQARLRQRPGLVEADHVDRRRATRSRSAAARARRAGRAAAPRPRT